MCDPATPELPAQLIRTAGGIELRLPWLDDQPSDRRLERWFAGDAHWGDDPDKSRYGYTPPEAFGFCDALGVVVLVGCWSRGYRRNFGLAGEGHIGVTYALPGASNAGRYAKVNGLRSQIDGLGSWYRRTVVVTKPVLDERSRIRAVDLHAEAPAETPVSRPLNLTLRPDFRCCPERVRTIRSSPRGCWSRLWSAVPARGMSTSPVTSPCGTCCASRRGDT